LRKIKNEPFGKVPKPEPEGRNQRLFYAVSNGGNERNCLSEF
jgi:hypothetical protein